MQRGNRLVGGHRQETKGRLAVIGHTLLTFEVFPPRVDDRREREIAQALRAKEPRLARAEGVPLVKGVADEQGATGAKAGAEGGFLIDALRARIEEHGRAIALGETPPSEVDPSAAVGVAGHGDDPGGRRRVEQVQQQARELIAGIHARGKRAILAGGSGLYVRAALDVLEFPGTDPATRRRLEAELEAGGPAPMRARLEAVDPVSAGRLGDARRIIRALEVFELTGRPFSSFMPTREYFQPAVQIGLEVDREQLRDRLARRVHAMVDSGLLDEVRRLDAAGLRLGRTAPRALGYAQFLKVLDGESDPATAAEETIVATRQFARRQLTWFRADPRIHWLDWQDPGLLAKAAALCL